VKVDFSGVEHELGGAMSMDAIHVQWVAEFLGLVAPSSVIEIGSYAGISTRAITAAYDEGVVENVHLIDMVIRGSVGALADGRDGVKLYEMPSTQALPKIDVAEDLVVIVDGDHSLGCVIKELPLVLAKRPLAIIAHDVVSEAAGYHQCDGARWLWESLQAEGWLCIVDARRRAGMATHRGLLIACRNDFAFGHAIQSWRKTCGD